MNPPDIPPATWKRMRQVFAAYPELTAVTLFGSRATGKATPRSDFDLATHGVTDEYRLGRLALDLEDLDIPQKCEVKAYESIRYAPLRRHIDSRGIIIYRQDDGQDDGFEYAQGAIFAGAYLCGSDDRRLFGR